MLRPPLSRKQSKALDELESTQTVRSSARIMGIRQNDRDSETWKR